MKSVLKKIPLGNRGMTIVELLVVMAILSVVMLAVISLYIPSYQSAVAQTQVADIQSGLRLALKTMTRDLLHAGFLAADYPVVFSDASGGVTNPTAIGTEDDSEFIIRTRIVGNDFARVTNAQNLTGKIRLTLSDADMVDGFPENSYVRLFEPINSTELTENPVQGGVNDDDRSYRVDAFGTNTVDIDISTNSTLDAADILEETVMVRVQNQSVNPLQTIRYVLTGTSLQRIVNGATQILARDINTDPASSDFDFTYTDEGKVDTVGIKLTGQTRSAGVNSVGDVKVRSVSTTVKLRNVF